MICPKCGNVWKDQRRVDGGRLGGLAKVKTKGTGTPRVLAAAIEARRRKREAANAN